MSWPQSEAFLTVRKCCFNGRLDIDLPVLLKMEPALKVPLELTIDQHYTQWP